MDCDVAVDQNEHARHLLQLKDLAEQKDSVVQQRKQRVQSLAYTMEQKKREQLLQIATLQRQEQDLEEEEEKIQEEAEKVEVDLAMLRHIEYERNLTYQQQLMHLNQSIDEKARRLENLEKAKQQIGLRERDLAMLEKEKPEQELNNLRQQLRNLEQSEQKARLESERRNQEILSMDQHIKQRHNALEQREHTILHRQQQSESSIAIRKRIDKTPSSLQRANQKEAQSPDQKRKRHLEIEDGLNETGELQNDAVEAVTKKARMSEALTPFQGGQLWDGDKVSVEVSHLWETLARFRCKLPPFNGDNNSADEID